MSEGVGPHKMPRMTPQKNMLQPTGTRLASTTASLIALALASGVSSCRVVQTQAISDGARSAGIADQDDSPGQQPADPQAQNVPVAGGAPQALPTGVAPEDAATLSLSSKGLVITSADGENKFKVSGRIQADVTGHSNDVIGGAEASDGTELRRGRFNIAGEQADGWLWNAEVDFGDNRTSVKDFWLANEGPDQERWTFGHQKQPFSLSVEMSSNDMSFVERGIDNFLVIPFIDRAIGARVDMPSENSLFSAGLYGEGVAGSATEDEGYGGTARYSYTPIRKDGEVLHVAVRGAMRTPSSDNTIRIRSESTNQSNLRITDTGLIGGVDLTTLYGFELAWASGPISFTGEYNNVDVDRDGADLNFTSWHLQGTYSLTGESRADAYRMKNGEFKRLKQATTGINPLDGGAWELAARFATIDAQDEFVDGGSHDALSMGVNWYANTNVRFMLDWTRILDTDGGSPVTDAAEDLDIYTLRAQFLF